MAANTLMDLGQGTDGYLSTDPYAGMDQGSYSTSGGGGFNAPPPPTEWPQEWKDLYNRTGGTGGINPPWLHGNQPGGQPGAPNGASGAYGGDPTDVDSWLQWMAQQPGHDPILDNPQGQAYYKTQILSKPDKLNANNLAYWQNKATLASHGGGVGAGEGGQGGFGSGWATLPSLDDAKNMPGIQFAIDRAKNTVQNSAAAKGTLLTGGTLKDLADYTTGAALQGYGNLANLNLNYLDANNRNLYNWANLGANASTQSSTGRPS